MLELCTSRHWWPSSECCLFVNRLRSKIIWKWTYGLHHMKTCLWACVNSDVRIHTVWSGPSLSTYRIIWYYRNIWMESKGPDDTWRNDLNLQILCTLKGTFLLDAAHIRWLETKGCNAIVIYIQDFHPTSHPTNKDEFCQGINVSIYGDSRNACPSVCGFMKETPVSLTLKAPRKTASENVVCLCHLLNILANFSKLFFAYCQTVWTQIRLLLVWSGCTLFAEMTFKITSRRQSTRQLLWLAV